MKTYPTILLVLLFVCCTGKKTPPGKKEEQTKSQKITRPELQGSIDAAHVNGSILIYDGKEDTYYSNDFEWAKTGRLPASTFKITNSIIALETEVVANDSTISKWNGEKRGLKIWEQDLMLKDAFRFSCVPCYQDIAQKIGAQRMNHYLAKLDYGHMQVDSTTIDIFWLEGESKISQFQQIDFLKRLYTSKLPISEHTETIVKKMMVIEENDDYTLRGKTGWSIRKGNNNGWFVGYMETENNTYFFATNITPKKDFDMNTFPAVRKEVTLKALNDLLN